MMTAYAGTADLIGALALLVSAGIGLAAGTRWNARNDHPTRAIAEPRHSHVGTPRPAPFDWNVDDPDLVS